jgi:catechol 2,3-dioxygenase-like lactoylglutathione lyase family enzyme
MPDAELRLDHVNMPARDPVTLAKWYAKSFGLRADEHRVRGPGVLLVFQRGEPIRDPELHLGLRVPSNSALQEWAQRFGAQITPGSEFNTFRTFDPEGNCLEIYCKADS